MGEFVRFSHSTGNNVHHFEWCTKYRYKMFCKAKNRAICRIAIERAAQRHGINLRKIAVQPDHIHVITELPPTMSQSRAAQLLKGGSSHEIFSLIPNFRLRYPCGTLWSRGNFKDSVGRITLEIAEHYVEEQSDVVNVFDFSLNTMHTKSAGFSPQYSQRHF